MQSVIAAAIVVATVQYNAHVKKIANADVNRLKNAPASAVNVTAQETVNADAGKAKNVLVKNVRKRANKF